MIAGAREIAPSGISRMDANGAAAIYAAYALFVVIFSQSNGVGNPAMGSPVEGTPAEPDHGIEIKTSGTIVDPIRDPVGQNDSYFDPANAGSAWPAFCGEFYIRTGQIPIILQLANNGSSYHTGGCGWDSWIDDVYAAAKTRLDTAISNLQAAGYGFSFYGALYWQGYTDGVLCGSDAETYELDMNVLYNWLNADYKADHPKMIHYIFDCPKHMTAIEAAKTAFVASHPDAWKVYDNQTNVIHLNQTQLNAAGIEAAQKIAGRE